MFDGTLLSPRVSLGLVILSTCVVGCAHDADFLRARQGAGHVQGVGLFVARLVGRGKVEHSRLADRRVMLRQNLGGFAIDGRSAL